MTADSSSLALLGMTTLRCQAVLFDLDGVLVDSRRCIEHIWEAWAARHEIDLATVIRAAHGRRTSETLRDVAPHLDIAAEVAYLDGLEEVERRGVSVMAGARELLTSIPRSRWAVVTSGSPAVARLRLEVGCLPEPPLLITADDVSQGKPHPEGYLRAATALGFSPEGCVVVEDTPAGIGAARAAGMRVIAVRGTYADERLRDADVIVDSVGALGCRATVSDGLELGVGRGSPLTSRV